MFTNKKGCTIYEKILKNHENIYVRHKIGAVYWENSFGEKSGKEWFERMKADHKDEILEGLKKL